MAERLSCRREEIRCRASADVVGQIVKHLGIALRNRDSSLVSCTDTKELDRVKAENWACKKLGVDGGEGRRRDREGLPGDGRRQHQEPGDVLLSGSEAARQARSV